MRASSLVDHTLFGPDVGPRKRERVARIDSGSTTRSGSTPTSPSGYDGVVKQADKLELPVRVQVKPTSSNQVHPVHPLVRRWQALCRRPEGIWQPSVLQIKPIAGIMALCVTISCACAALMVLIISDGEPIESWPVQPTVYLAIASALANSSLALARMEAIPISWWFSASRGRTIGSLERQ
ncbi:uncharacterized protein LTR77_006868 [Saxophila tyrrhenica]|uniref:Uncharacterized protein n=1 Tax=Saxophila tyrrhenica TaxID=1690608 RepID=A0AAV9P614_9PEZI|nr:hypothetical protein LTR77_006868 [Saxophila tyrrhenica]